MGAKTDTDGQWREGLFGCMTCRRDSYVLLAVPGRPWRCYAMSVEDAAMVVVVEHPDKATALAMAEGFLAEGLTVPAWANGR